MRSKIVPLTTWIIVIYNTHILLLSSRTDNWLGLLPRRHGPDLDILAVTVQYWTICRIQKPVFNRTIIELHRSRPKVWPVLHFCPICLLGTVNTHGQLQVLPPDTDTRKAKYFSWVFPLSRYFFCKNSGWQWGSFTYNGGFFSNLGLLNLTMKVSNCMNCSKIGPLDSPYKPGQMTTQISDQDLLCRIWRWL